MAALGLVMAMAAVPISFVIALRIDARKQRAYRAKIAAETKTARETWTTAARNGYRAFWINGHAQAVRFDDDYRENAYRVAKERVRKEAPVQWHVGASLGAVVGELKKVDVLDAENEFAVVPPTGGPITCVFPETMKDELGRYLFKMARVSGVLHYNEESPFPYRVVVRDGGLEKYPPRERGRTMMELRGVFAGAAYEAPNWDALLNGE